MPSPAGHRSRTRDWCDVCGRPVGAVPAAIALIAADPDWFTVAGLAPPTATPHRVRLEHRRTVLGRRRNGRPTVSARHAALVATDGGWTVVDLGSRNGTTVGTERLRPLRAVPLPPGAVIRLGLWTSVRIEP